MTCILFYKREQECVLYMVNVVGNARVSPLRPRWVLAKGVATVFSAPARIMTKKEYLVDSAIIERQKDIIQRHRKKTEMYNIVQKRQLMSGENVV